LSIKTKILMALGGRDENILKSVCNITKVSVIASDSLNVVDLLKNDMFVINKEGLKKIEETYKYEF